MAYQLYTYQAKSADQVRADILRTISNGLTLNQGIATPNVGPNSDYYLIAQGVGNELAVVHANTVVQVDNNMPDTAGGTQLRSLAGPRRTVAARGHGLDGQLLDGVFGHYARDGRERAAAHGHQRVALPGCRRHLHASGGVPRRPHPVDRHRQSRRITRTPTR